MMMSAVQQITAYLTFMVTVGLVVASPRVGRVQLKPELVASIAVLVLLAASVLTLGDIAVTVEILWRPMVAITSIMVLAAAAERLGVLEWLANFAERMAGNSTQRLYRLLFAMAAGCSAVLNNDTTILLFTPLVIALVRRRYPKSPKLVIPFAFVVFMAAGVAPFMISNPMNMVVASTARIGFNAYALYMVPVALSSWIVSYLVLRLLFSNSLAAAPEPVTRQASRAVLRKSRKQGLALLIVTLATYPIVAYLDGPVWVVAAVGAGLACCLTHYHGSSTPATLLRTGVSWGTLAFLVAVFLLGAGLRNAGIVDDLAAIYEKAGIVTIGICAAAGSAVMNNHPMAIVNLMALGGQGAEQREILAALIGGDLGPRLLPMGSLAGLMWVALLARAGVHVSVGLFFRVGLIVLVPTLTVALAVFSVL